MVTIVQYLWKSDASFIERDSHGLVAGDYAFADAQSHINRRPSQAMTALFTLHAFATREMAWTPNLEESFARPIVVSNNTTITLNMREAYRQKLAKQARGVSANLARSINNPRDVMERMVAAKVSPAQKRYWSKKANSIEAERLPLPSIIKSDDFIYNHESASMLRENAEAVTQTIIIQQRLKFSPS